MFGGFIAYVREVSRPDICRPRWLERINELVMSNQGRVDKLDLRNQGRNTDLSVRNPEIY